MFLRPWAILVGMVAALLPASVFVPSNAINMDRQAVSVAPEDGADIFLAVEVGRLDLMVDQIALLLDRPALAHHAEAAPRTPQAARLRLEATAARFNALLPAACYCAHVVRDHCRPYDVPQQIRAPADLAEDLFQHVFPVWHAVCRGHASRCQLE